MKAIPKEELIQLIEMHDQKLIYKDWIEDLFYTYGDDYYKDSHDSPFELCKSNAERKALLKAQKEMNNDSKTVDG